MADWDRKPGFDLTGKRALVVGCANPAGRAIALGLAEAGADVAIVSATLDGDEIMEAKRIAKKVEAEGRKSISQGWDVTLPTNVQVGLKRIGREFGKPSILVYNADASLAKPIEKTTERVRRIQAINQSGAFYSARSFLKEFPKANPDDPLCDIDLRRTRDRELQRLHDREGGCPGPEHGPEPGTWRARHNFQLHLDGMDGLDARARWGRDRRELLLRFIPCGASAQATKVAALAVLLCSGAAGTSAGRSSTSMAA